MKGTAMRTVLCLATILAVVAFACETETSVEDLSVPEQIELAFEGGLSWQERRPLMDRAMTLYNLPINSENYSRASSSLIVMRREFGVREVDMLDYMIRSHVQGVELEFSEAAAIAAVFLEAGER